MSSSIIHFLDKDNIKSQTFTTSGNFVVPSGITTLIIEGQGAGGGGARRDVTSAGIPLQGGGAGDFSLRFLKVTPGQNVAVTIGSGGIGPNSGTGSVAGGDGGVTSVDSLVWRPGRGGSAGVFESLTILNGSGSGGSAALHDISGSGGGGPTYALGLPQDGPSGSAGAGPGGGGGSGLGNGGDSGSTASAGTNGGVGAGGGSGNPAGDGGRGEVTIYWIDNG